MGDGTKIEWADATWPVTTGCAKISPGCDNCYAATLTSGRLAHLPAYEGLAIDGDFTGDVRLLPDRLDWPLRWTRPRKIFVASMSDLFHDRVPDEYLARVFAVMALAPAHTFQVLTKRHGRMKALLDAKPSDRSVAFRRDVAFAAVEIAQQRRMPLPVDLPWPLPNLWIGCSVENQQWADIRIPALVGTLAAVRFLSVEPMIGPVTMRRYVADYLAGWRRVDGGGKKPTGRVGWVIVGGESGPNHRPLDLDWVRRLRDECVESGVPFLFKQVGGRTPKAGGRELDGREYTEYPEAAAV